MSNWQPPPQKKKGGWIKYAVLGPLAAIPDAAKAITEAGKREQETLAQAAQEQQAGLCINCHQTLEPAEPPPLCAACRALLYPQPEGSKPVSSGLLQQPSSTPVPPAPSATVVSAPVPPAPLPASVDQALQNHIAALDKSVTGFLQQQVKEQKITVEEYGKIAQAYIAGKPAFTSQEALIEQLRELSEQYPLLAVFYQSTATRFGKPVKPASVPATGAVSPSPTVILGNSKETGRSIPLSQAARRQGMYMLGVNGTGKSTLIANLIVQDIHEGIGVCLLDPHGDLTHEVLSRVPDNRIGDVILLDLLDSRYPFGLNLFECPDKDNSEQVALTASFVMHVFQKVWGVGTETPQLSQVLRNVSVTLIANPGTTFNEIPLLLQDETVRGKLIGSVTNNQVRLFWQMYNKMRPVDQMERTSSTLNKVDAFLTQPIIANIVGQSETTLDFRKIMDEGKILLVQLTPQLEDISSLVGSVIIGQLLNAALSRKDVPEEERKQFNLYADEYQRFATEDFATLLSEARKFGIATTIAHQTRSQLDIPNKGATLNAAIKIVFRVTGEDGKELAREFDHTPTVVQIGEEPVRAPITDPVQHLLTKGHANPRATAFNQQLNALQDYIGQKIDRPVMYSGEGFVDSAVTGIFNLRDAKKYKGAIAEHMEIRDALKTLNEYWYVVMQTGDSSIPIPGEILNPFYALMKRLKSSDETFRDNFVIPIQIVTEVLAKEPILVDTGQYRPKYQQRTYADMEGEIASTLTNLPNFQARIKTVKGETTIITQPPVTGITGQAFDERREQVVSQTRAAYCRPVTEVEQEIADRQAALMEEEERVQGRRETVGGEGQVREFRPSRRHKEPPPN